MAEPEVAIVQIDPANDRFTMLTAALAERIAAYATDHQPDVIPQEYTRAVLAKLWLGDGTLLALGLIQVETSKLVGHLLADHAAFGHRSSVWVRQARCDTGISGLREALDQAEEWAFKRGADMFFCQPHRDWKDWTTDRRGFHLVTHTVGKRLTATE